MGNENIRVNARTVNLRAAADDDDLPARFNGIAVGIGDILHMDDGTPVLFTEEELRAAAQTQSGEPLTVDHPSDDNGRPQYPPPTDQTVGKVSKAGFIEGRGVGYEATTHDEDLAKGIQAESYEVSVHPNFTLGDRDPETGAYKAENINFRDLSVVSRGDSPANTVSWGPSQELAAWAHEHDISEELEASYTPEGGEEAGRNVARGFADELRQKLGLTANEPAESGDDEETMPEDPEDPDDPDNGGDDEEEEQNNTVEVDIGDHESFDEFISAQVEEQIEEATAQKNKEEKVDELIAESTDFDEDNREELMASSEALIESHLSSLGSASEGLPGNAGTVRHSATASLKTDDDDNSVYGAGVEH